MPANTLYYGDNLDILRRYVADESVDLVDREEAVIGVLISMQETTKPMREEAATAGFYTSPWGKHPQLQLLTVDDLLGGKGIDCPPLRHTSQTFKKAPKATKKNEAPSLFGEDAT